jgi:hypothetical protein
MQILPLFSMAVQRSMEELNARIQAFITRSARRSTRWSSGARKAVLKGMTTSLRTPTPGRRDGADVLERIYPLYALGHPRPRRSGAWRSNGSADAAAAGPT